MPSWVMPSLALAPLSLRPVKLNVPDVGAALSTFTLMTLPVTRLPDASVAVARKL